MVRHQPTHHPSDPLLPLRPPFVLSLFLSSLVFLSDSTVSLDSPGSQHAPNKQTALVRRGRALDELREVDEGFMGHGRLRSEGSEGVDGGVRGVRFGLVDGGASGAESEGLRWVIFVSVELVVGKLAVCLDEGVLLILCSLFRRATSNDAGRRVPTARADDRIGPPKGRGIDAETSTHRLSHCLLLRLEQRAILVDLVGSSKLGRHG
jgi:hypothetical protein